MTLQGEGPYRGYPAFFVRLAKCNLACTFCFVAGTQIMMAGGKTKPIEDVETGDTVVTWNDGKWEEGKVTRTYITTTDELLKLEFTKGKKVFCTPEHPFYVKGREWVAAKDLSVDDVILHYPDSERMRAYNPMKNPIIAEKVSETQKGKPGFLNVAWNDPEFRKQHDERMRNNNPNHDPAVAIKGFLNRTDHKKTYIEEIFEKAVSDLPITFVGHGDLVVNNLVPDFMVDGQNKLIEVWDDEQTIFWGRDEAYKDNRRAKFKEAGYEVEFIPFTKKTDVGSIRQAAAEFVSNGYVLKSVTSIKNDGNGSGSNGKAWVRLAGAKGQSATVYNFEVEGTHNYVANGLLTHNCDTYFDNGDWFSIDELMKETNSSIVEHFNGTLPPYMAGEKKEAVFVLTGGEPMLQKNIKELLEAVNKEFRYSQIESNGTVYTEIPDETILVVSPKCLEKNGSPVRYLTPRAETLERADCLKFVMCADEESPYSSVPEWAFEWQKKTGKQIFISPMNVYNKFPRKFDEEYSTDNINIGERSNVDEVISFWEEGLLDMKANQINHEYTANYCVKHGFTYNLQQHLYAGLA